MGTNPLGRGTKNVSVNMPEELKAALEVLAAKSGLTLSAYIKTILADAVSNRAKVTRKIEKASGERTKEK